MTKLCTTIRIWTVAPLIALFLYSPALRADEGWTDFHLGEVEFSVPSDWQMTLRVRDLEYAFESADGSYDLLAFWWQPDEPLLGYSDIVGHTDIEVAGRAALLIRSQTGDSHTLQLVFNEPRDDGFKFMLNISTSTQDYDDLGAQLVALMDHLQFAETQKPEAVLPSAPSKPRSVIWDETGEFTFSLPAYWTHYASDVPGARQVVIASPELDALAVVFAATGEGSNADVALDQIENLLLQETLIPMSIEGDGTEVINGDRAIWVEILARAYAIGGVRPSFDNGTARIYRIHGDRKFLIAYVTPDDAPSSQRELLDFLVHSVTAGAPDETKPFEQSKIVVSEPSQDSKNPWLDAVSRHLGAECRLVDLLSWHHPAQANISGRPEMNLQWVGLCGPDSYPVFGVQSDYDPRGDTDAFFHPLYVDTLLANERRDYAFVETGDNLMVALSLTDQNTLNVTYRELDIAPQQETSPAIVVVEEAPQDDETAPPAVAEASATPRTDSPEVLFSANSKEGWRPFSRSGGNFDTFASFSEGLVVTVPEGHSWGTTGIVSTEPVVQFGASRHLILGFDIDPARSRNFVMTLVPADYDGDDSWGHQKVAVSLGGAPDEKPVLALDILRKRVAEVVLAPNDVPTTLALEILLDGTVFVRGGDGSVVLEGVLPAKELADEWRLFAQASASFEGGTAMLALQRITLEQLETTDVLPIDAVLAEPHEWVLFGDGPFGHDWMRFEAHGGSFAAHARLSAEALIVDVPEGHHFGRVGLAAARPLIWLDSNGRDAETRVTLTFDPSRTDGMAVVLSANHTLNGSEPGNPRFRIDWHKTPEGHRAVALWNADRNRLELSEGVLMPDQVTLVLRKGSIRIEAPGFPEDGFVWPVLEAGQGLRLHVFSSALEAGHPVRMALKEILLYRDPGQGNFWSGPTPGVDPLDSRQIFNGAQSASWEPAQVNGPTFAGHARFENGLLKLEYPKDTFNWGKVGLLSSEPLFTPDHRLRTTPFEITLSFDKSQSTGVQVLLSDRKEQDMWGRRQASVALLKQETGPWKGDWSLGIDRGPYVSWSRQIPSEWIDTTWNGDLIIRIREGRLEAHLPGGPLISGGGFTIGPSSKLFATVMAHPSYDHGGARLALKAIHTGWMTPVAMTAVERSSLQDDEDFDVDGFLTELMDLEGSQ